MLDRSPLPSSHCLPLCESQEAQADARASQPPASEDELSRLVNVGSLEVSTDPALVHDLDAGKAQGKAQSAFNAFKTYPAQVGGCCIACFWLATCSTSSVGAPSRLSGCRAEGPPGWLDYDGWQQSRAPAGAAESAFSPDISDINSNLLMQ